MDGAVNHADKTTCDAEVGHYTRGWHVCNKRASITVVRPSGYSLDYCKRHKSKAHEGAGEVRVTP